jgi:FtsP/CotA-like multicopper oxidase with cupredoxin domain
MRASERWFTSVVPRTSSSATSATRRPPNPKETGEKETVRMNPGEMTKVIMSFQVPSGAPVSVRTGEHNYVWHCHIEHEEHDYDVSVARHAIDAAALDRR